MKAIGANDQGSRLRGEAPSVVKVFDPVWRRNTMMEKQGYESRNSKHAPGPESQPAAGAEAMVTRVSKAAGPPTVVGAWITRISRGLSRFSLLCLLTAYTPGFTAAEEIRWTSSGGGKWEQGGNWSLGIPPNINHDVLIANGISGPPLFGNVLVDSTTAAQPGNMVVASLQVGSAGGLFSRDDVLSLFDAGLVTPLTVLSSAVISNRGIVTITGSVLDVRDGLAVNGGSVVLNSNSLLSVKGNNYPAYDFAVNGSVTLNAGLLSFSNDFATGMGIGSVGQGTLTQSGGEWRVADAAFLNVGGQTGSVGTVMISGGMASLEGQSFAVGADAGSTGSVWLTGGELITADAYIGRGGVGRMTVSNGIWRAKAPNGVVVGQASSSVGMLMLAGGTSIFSTPLAVGSTGSLLMTGGEFLITNDLVGIGGFAVISNGVWRAKEVHVPLSSFHQGRLLFAGGSTMISSFLRIGEFSCSSTGLVTITGGDLIITNAATNAILAVVGGTFRLEGGTVKVDTIALTSPCARFERTGGTLIYRTAELDPLRDDDGDGAPNGLEQNAGFDPLDPREADADTDGDGATDADELVAGTDPRNSNSVVKIISILPQGEDIRLRWTTVGGKTNIVQAVSGPENSGFTNEFADLASIAIQGTGDRTNTFIEPEGAIKGPSRFYRVKVVP